MTRFAQLYLGRLAKLGGLAIVLGLVASGSNVVDLLISAQDVGPGDDRFFNDQQLNSDIHIRMEFGTTTADNTGWSSVSLTHEYESMVVIATPNYSIGSPPLVTRIQNAASGSSFDLRVQRVDGSSAAISPIVVHYLVVEEGVYTAAAHGVTMEAVKYLSTITDYATNNWTGEVRSYANAYVSPLVLGQVMTYNDSQWSVFWASGPNRTTPPDASNLDVGKHVAEDNAVIRANETVGYIVLEEGSGSLEGSGYTAGVGSDSVEGFGDSPPYTYALSGIASASVAIVSSAAMDDNNGGWPVLVGASPLTSTTIDLAIQEDLIGDAEDRHRNEQVAYLVFE